MAYANEGSATSIKPASVQSSLEDFDPVLARLEEIASRAAKCGDRIAGARPSEVGNEKDAPSPNHLIYAVQVRRSRLVRVVDHLENEIQRIESGLA
jgi:hypothetical protein